MTEPTGREHLTPVEITDTSATERAGFRKCRRQWLLTTVHRLDPQEGSVNFFVGGLFHSGLEAYYRAVQGGQPVETAEDAAMDAYQRAFDGEVKKIKAQLAFAWKTAEPMWREAGALGFDMLQRYLERERDEPLLDEVIAVEFRVSVPILSPSGEEAGRLSVQTDVVGMKDGELVVADHKTASSVPNSAHLDLDDQLTAEVYSWWKHSGEFPERAVYNVAFKKSPEPPRLLKSGKLSTAKSTLHGTTLAMFEQAITDHGLKRADYLDAITALRAQERAGDQFFKREATFRTPGQMTAFERDLYYEFTDMKEVAAEPERAYPNPSPFNCPSCPVRAICVTIQDDGDVEAITRAGYVVSASRR